MRNWVTQLRKGLVEYYILLFLARGESYGYQIVQALKQYDEMAVNESTIYPVLARLKADGYLAARTVPPTDGPSRTYLSLSSSGKERLAAMHRYWDNVSHSVLSQRSLIAEGGHPDDEGSDQVQHPSLPG